MQSTLQMHLTQLVPRQVFLDAKHYVEAQAVPFFDFYRNCAFGFVRVAEKKGYFPHLQVLDDGELVCRCNCHEADYDEVCGHGFALYLKFIDWPMRRGDVSAAFEAHPLVRLFKLLGHRMPEQIGADTNPTLLLDEVRFEARYLNYWNLLQGTSKLAVRDQKALAQAKTMARPASDWALLEKGFPSGQLRFEESRLYAIAKLFFYLDRRESGLHYAATKQGDHQVRLSVSQGRETLFQWDLPVGTFFKGIKDDREFWLAHCDFDVRREACPVIYRIGFTVSGGLTIEPLVDVAFEDYVSVTELTVPGSSNLYHHPQAGYFRIQTGLSPFEMTYSDVACSEIAKHDVAKFLKQHRNTLENLDRTLIDEAVLGEVITDQFESLRLELSDFRDGRFHFNLSGDVGGQQFPANELQRMFTESGRYRKLGGRLFDMAGFDGAYLESFLATDGDPQLTVGDFFRLMMLFKERLDVSTDDMAAAVMRDLERFEPPQLPSLDHTNLALRAYQETGYNWLYFLKTHGLGGLLCDQMGLGKTHQGMALAAATLAENPDGKVLIIAPTSVLFHWKDKLATFCPVIKAAVFHGSDRELTSTLANNQVLLTSYGVARNDINLLRDVAFDVVIFDEIQFVKNKSTRAYKALCQLRAACRIGLTGTPIENHVVELKNLLDLVFHGYLGSDTHFDRHFVRPIVKANSHPAKEKLQQVIHPFVLRRSKSEVLVELPPKTEDLRHFELSGYERELYREVREQGRKQIAASGETGTLMVFQVIDKLKRLCNHPALYFDSDDYAAYPSTKWAMFTELMDESLDSGEKVVVFSQYLRMIDMIRAFLDQRGIHHACITGATRDREGEQRRFMEDPNCRVFVGSLKASGVGIDLTSASILIHYDRWWNPAREEQATDRIHRIGQEKNVQVYKFMGLNTVEERIDQLIRQKRALLDDVVGFDAESVGKTFSVEELLEMLA